MIDFHTHCFPEKLAGKVIGKLSHEAGGIIPQTDGTAKGLRKVMAQEGVKISVVMNIATNARQMKTVNDFAASIQSEDLICFGSVHPDNPEALDELDRIKELGLKGVKFHPDYQGFYPDEERMHPIYEKIGRLGLITLFHAGEDIGFAPPYHGTPEHMLKALTWFASPVVLAHWGGAFCHRQVLGMLCGLPVYFDTSFGYGAMPRYYAQKMIEKHGIDRMLFGTDQPWQRPSMSLALLQSLDLTKEEMDRICEGNAEALLGLSI